MTVHHLKTWPEYFQEVRSGAKTFEARKDDRDYQVGDTLVLEEFDPTTKMYTGEDEVRGVTYILRGTEHVAPGYCVLGFSHPPRLVVTEPCWQGTITLAKEEP